MVKFASGYITDAAVADAGLMVFAGLKYVNQTTGKPTFKNYYDGVDLNVDAEAFIYDDPYQVYEAQGDTAATAAMIGTMDHIETHDGVLQLVFQVMKSIRPIQLLLYLV